eukprot:2836863-Rhodomonas_salina.2
MKPHVGSSFVTFPVSLTPPVSVSDAQAWTAMMLVALYLLAPWTCWTARTNRMSPIIGGGDEAFTKAIGT